MQRLRLVVCATVVGSWAVAQAEVLEKQTYRQPVSHVEDAAVLDGEPLNVTFERNVATERNVADAQGSAGTCHLIGDFLNPFSGTPRYRGNVYRIDLATTISELQMELAFAGTTNFYVSIHRHEGDGTWKRYPPDSSDIVIPAVVGAGSTTTMLVSTGEITPHILLEPGFDYAIGFSWTGVIVYFARDFGPYPQSTPASFDVGQVVGLVGLNNAPPTPDEFASLTVSNVGAYSMVVCFEPVPGACCDAAVQGCRERLPAECVSAGSYFHGERTSCLDTVCEFGACCSACGSCDDIQIRQPCVAGGGSFWPRASCPTPETLLCSPVTGACCNGSTCSLNCEAACVSGGGTYRGHGTDCDPNICRGACCVSGGCLNRTLSSCAASSGTHKGDGTTCLTLPPELECGGACCRGFAIDDLQFCQQVAQRSDCGLDPEGFPYSAYRGDGTTCPTENNTCNKVNDVVQVYRACCLSDGMCINTTQSVCGAAWVAGTFNASVTCEDAAPSLCPSSLQRCCFTDGRCELMTPAGCSAHGGTAISAQTTCPLNACAGFVPVGACCGATAGACSVITESQCRAGGGVFQGNGTNCTLAMGTCPGFGACCRSDGACFDEVTAAQCGILTGDVADYQGDGSFCDAPALDCDLRGACCADTGQCLYVLEEQCAASTAAGVPRAACRAESTPVRTERARRSFLHGSHAGGMPGAGRPLSGRQHGVRGRDVRTRRVLRRGPLRWRRHSGAMRRRGRRVRRGGIGLLRERSVPGRFVL